MMKLTYCLLPTLLMSFACTVVVKHDDDDSPADEPAEDDDAADDSDDEGGEPDAGDDEDAADDESDDAPTDDATAEAGAGEADDEAPADDTSESDDTASADDDTSDAGADEPAPVEGGSTDDELCTEVFQQCTDDNTVTLCAAEGEPPVSFECANGCDADTGSCLPMSLENGWAVHQFQLEDDSIQVDAAYVFEEDGLVAIQSANPMASAYVNDRVLRDMVVQGQITVTTTSDDDYFGFVFGWQDPSHFYLLDWKQTEQNDSTCGLAREGFSLKVVDADAEPSLCADFWDSDGTDSVTTLVNAEDNSQGWLDNTTYDFTLVHKPGQIEVTISDGDDVVVQLTSDDSTYAQGMFGFYNYSQEDVRYEFFSVNPAQ